MKKTLMTASVICISLMLAGIGYAYGPENVMGMWLLDENSGDMAGDSSGNGNDGMLNGGPVWVPGVFGSCLLFDGSNNVEIADAPTMDAELANGLTFVGWQNQPAGDADGGYLVKEEGWENGMSYRFFSNHGNDFGFMVVPQDGTVEEYYGGAPQDDTWHHVAAVYTGSEIIGYMDAVEVGRWPYDKGVADNDSRAFIGSGHPNGEYFPGMLDDLALFNVPLSQAEIAEIMDVGLAGVITAAVFPADKLATTWGKIK